MRDRKIKSLGRGKRRKKAERETLPGGRRGGWKTYRFGPEMQRWVILIVLSIITPILLYPNILTTPRIYKLGDVADRDIKAFREFLVENTELTEKKRDEAVRAVPPVYDFDPTGTNIVTGLSEAFESGRKYLATGNASDGQPLDRDSFKKQFFEILEIPFQQKVIDTLVRTGFPTDAERAISQLIAQALQGGVVGNKSMLMRHSSKGVILQDILTQKETKVTDLNRFHDLDSAKASVLEMGKDLNRSLHSPQLADASLKLATSLIKPNLTFNKRETEIRKDLAWKNVKPFYFKVKKGEMLMREGERITSEHLLKLKEQYKFLNSRKMMGRAPAMAVLIALLLLSMYMVGLMTHRSRQSERRDLLFDAVTLLTVFLVAMASNFMAEEVARGYHSFTSWTLLFAAPVASGAMLVSIFQGMRVAASFSLIVSVLTSIVVGGRVEFFLYFFISSLVAGHGVRHCRERGVFIKTGMKVSLTNVILAFSIEALHGTAYNFETVAACTAAFTGGILVAIIAAGILPLIEICFGFTTDIKLLELASLDQPLLQELMVQAPGTYHHSVIVSNMVEATAKAINANPLLSKVAAYYHDIGKMRKPLYFIENQIGSQNKHEKLAPSMSSLILIAHVKEGVELAKRNKLGRELIDIIRQHHGTSLITYFYEKAKEQVEKKGKKLGQVNEEAFRYPGPKPQTKEAGLVMLADAVEAATKTLVDPTPARIQGMVQQIINKVFFDGQLDECELTLKDLHEIARNFNKTLSGIFHHRIEYPGPSTKPISPHHRESVIGATAGESGQIGANGHSDQISPKSSWSKKTENKTETKKNLRRLGLP